MAHRDASRSPALGAVLLLAVVYASDAGAWGVLGHRIIADLAEARLAPATALAVHELLALEGASSLADVASWADEIRSARRNTSHWHFVDIPIHPAAGEPARYDPARDCPGGNCVVDRITAFSAVLHDRHAAPAERLEALKFVTHFVGDLHQPMHCADDNDRGGNEIMLRFVGRRRSLHAVWDTALLARVGDDDSTYATRLARATTPAQRVAWRGGTVADWANESHDIARRFIYGPWAHEPGAELTTAYEADALPVLDQQLARAGVRLAALLDRTLP